MAGVRCAALCYRLREKAERLAQEFGVPAVYEDAEELLEREKPKFVDVITDVDTHSRFEQLAAARGVGVICQKPMAPTLAIAEEMVAALQPGGRAVLRTRKLALASTESPAEAGARPGARGPPFLTHIDFCSSFPVFENQPLLKQLEQVILTDVGNQILDVARFLVGEAHDLHCRTHRIDPEIRGEDVATVMMEMGEGTTVVCNLSYASRSRGLRPLRARLAKNSSLLNALSF